MTDYTKLVEALRLIGKEQDCNECEAGKWYRDIGCCLFEDAADAIEALQAKVDTLKRTDSKRCQECLYLGQPVGEQMLPKRGEWELIDGAEPMRWGCSQCKYLSWDTPNYCPRCGAKMEVQE